MFDSTFVPFARHRRRRRARGITLIEVLIVVAILAMVSGGVAIKALAAHEDAQRRAAATDARVLRQAVKGWWFAHGDSSCPTVPQLVNDGALDKDSPHRDPWGGAWRIECANDDVTIVSLGRDQKEGTEDDIRIPPA